MKGIVFNLLEQSVARRFSEDVWDNLLERSGLSGAYTSLGGYPDSEFRVLLESTSVLLGTSPADALRWLGREATPILAERYPNFFKLHNDARSFVLSVNSVIHPEVRKVYPTADCPNFGFEDCEDGSLLMTYRSQRKLCDLAHGFIQGAADHYNQRLEIRHVNCMHKGDPSCILRLRFNIRD